ncbi:unannotated protein [freshwater metagenome]|uniref:Unannotated protein n=1 Tax=freshwater metagenome TaxID=449393 RepID=A0A6J7D0R1_9ZZZZ|nr:hypothetical protein [Actinomycetota bacterium]
MALLGVLAGAVPAPAKPANSAVETSTTWTASHTLLISSSSSTQSVNSDPVAINQLQLFAITGEVPKRVAKSIGYDGAPAALAAQVTVAVDQNTGALRITTKQSTAELSVQVADAFADELTKYIAERQDSLQFDRLAASRERLDSLKTDIEKLEPVAAANPNDKVTAAQLDALSRQYSVAFEQLSQLQVDRGQLQLTTLERAQAIAVEGQGGVSGISAPTSRTSRGILLGGVGGMVGFGVVLLLAKLDRRIRTRTQAETIFGLRSQVAIPITSKEAAAGMVVVPGRHDVLSDAYRTLRSVVGFVEGGAARAAGRAPVVLVISSGSGDGKTSVSTNLAAAFVETGMRTVAVNTDFRRPSLTERILGRKSRRLGFSFEDLANMPVAVMLSASNVTDLAIFDLAGIDASPGDLARETARLLPELSALASAVVIDSSPVGATAEVLELVPHADVIVIVTRLNHSTIESATRCIEIVRALSNAHLVLTVVGEAAERSGYYEYAGSVPNPSRWRSKSAD